MQSDWTFFRRVSALESTIFEHLADSVKTEHSKDRKIILSGPSIDLIFPQWKNDQEAVLFIAPHDDDNHLGAGLLTQAVIEYGGKSFYLIITDGSQGYYDPISQEIIVETRKRENIEASEILGVTHQRIKTLGLPDGNLPVHNVTTTSDNKKGLYKLITEAIRGTQATRIIVPTYTDIHQDHKVVNEAVVMSTLQAGVEIWKELGQLADPKTLLMSAVYCNFGVPPNCSLRAPESAFEKKIRALEAFQSQKQINQLVEQVRRDGPYENFLGVNQPNYSAGHTHSMYFTGR